ncbi:hypothetical protein Htur_1713 [Haloterrigena turkmenica DSM 5511]|uniref:Uncharacterized protein n=1 Tax=Haloterrigena turkmenica (strain ATCC 51198 / DSM 5511 / JCM 9101 / NCIMB 13204 / VKM B-1734 / 4k) TaxID=543526 RepID=D2RRN8_HALTV|nr:hypothetical protein [Haloterrigena turkmenica]ADB60598.1 hypothetical protein Htur_1713 [Haloterrigena turkmenica DSM 5511]
MADPDDELAEAVRELTRTIEELRSELESTRRRPPFRPPAPRPPTPRELLAFTDEVAIPAAIAALETSVRALSGFQRVLQLARTERDVRDRTTDATQTAGERADDLRRSTLSGLDTVLAELQRAASDGDLPADEGARELLSEARELRDDVDRRLRDAADDLERRSTDATDAVRIDIEDGDPRNGATGDDERDPDPEPDPSVDVDAELETLKDQYGHDDADADDSGENDSAESDASNDDGAAADDDDSDSSENGSDAA